MSRREPRVSGDRPPHNAGIARIGYLPFAPIEAVKQVVEVDVIRIYSATHAMIDLVHDAKGRTVTTFSIAGTPSSATTGLYCVSKHAA